MNYTNYFTNDERLAYKMDVGSVCTRNLFLPWVNGTVLEVGPGMNRICKDSYSIDIKDGVSIEDTGLSSGFDVIIMSHVLEHVKSDLKAIRECERLLKPGGRLVVVSPANKSMICTDKEVANNGHIRRYNRNRVQWLESENFPCIYFRYVHGLHNLVWNRLKYVLKAINYPMRKLDGKSIYARKWYAWIQPGLIRVLNKYDRGGNAFFVMEKQ